MESHRLKCYFVLITCDIMYVTKNLVYTFIEVLVVDRELLTFKSGIMFRSITNVNLFTCGYRTRSLALRLVPSSDALDMLPLDRHKLSHTL